MRPDSRRVSLVIGAYNASSSLGSALASVAGQTRPFDEVVVVDDCSADATSETASVWQGHVPLTIVRMEVNGGPGAARRFGIEQTTNDLIALLDADDVLLPDHLQAMLDTHAERDAGLVTAEGLWWRPGIGISRTTGRERKKVPVAHQQRRGILEHNFVHPTTLFSRADYDRAGGFNDLRHMEDWDLWIRMVHNGVRVRMPPTPTVLYRIHGDSQSAGRACLPTNVERLPTYLPDLPPDERRVLLRTIRRRKARMDLLAGERAQAVGSLAQASALWVQAATRDRNLRGGLTGGRSSVTVQAIANLVTLGGLGRMRRARASSGSVSR